MKIVRYGAQGAEQPGIIDNDGGLRALHPLVSDVSCDMLTPEFLAALAAIDSAKLPLVEGEVRLGVPVSGIRQIVAIGLNYRDHAEESGMEIPTYPLLFSKSIGSLAGCADDIVVPASAKKLDWEIELGFVIGTAARDVPAEQALNHVAGYCTVIDVSEREWQFERGGTIGKGKSYDTFTPVGPWFVTKDEVANPQDLELWLNVNGVQRQRGTTADMIFSVAEIIAHVSTYQTLLPGDLVITGTPAGVAFGMKPPAYLSIGDEISCGIQRLGEQHHKVIRKD